MVDLTKPADPNSTVRTPGSLSPSQPPADRSLFQWFSACLSKYAVFKGRAQRKEYLGFLAYYMLFFFFLILLDALLGTYSERNEIGLFSGLFMLAMLMPGLGVTVRRLHDIGWSGLWVIISIIPLIGFICALCAMLVESKPGENAWGPNPKGVAA